MKPQVLSMIELALASDDSLSPGEREAILTCCHHPRSGQGFEANEEDLVFLTAVDVAAKLQVHVRTVKRYIQDGKLPSVKCLGVRRVRLSDLRRFLDYGASQADLFETVKELPDAGHRLTVEKELKKG